MDKDEVLNSPVIKKFNWGAFSSPIFWGLGNNSYMTLLSLIPVFNFAWIFVCGFKGNKWAFENGDYKSLEEFEKVQDTWNRAGVVRFIFNTIISCITGYFLYNIVNSLFLIINDLKNFPG